MNDAPDIYRASAKGADDCLRQGEIIADLMQAKLTLESIGNEPEVDFVEHPFAVLITQDCDLEQDFAVRQTAEDNDKLLPNLLFCEVFEADKLFARVAESRKKQWERMNIPKNKNERFHFLQQVDKECDAENAGLPEMGIDFKRHFTLPTAEVYQRVHGNEAKRRCILNSPYMEHLSSRFAYFLSRIALPTDHISE